MPVSQRELTGAADKGTRVEPVKVSEYVFFCSNDFFTDSEGGGRGSKNFC